jgi:hypothetical protein
MTEPRLEQHARQLLAALEAHRDRLLEELMVDPTELESPPNDKMLDRLATVQNCILAAREYLAEGQAPRH